MPTGYAPLPAPLLKAYESDPRRKLAEALLARATNENPVYSTGQGLTRLASALVSGYQQGKIRRDYEGQAADYQTKLAQALTKAGAGDWAGATETAGSNPHLQDFATQLSLKRAEAAAKANEPTTTQRNFEFFQKLAPEQQQAFSSLYGKKGQSFRVTSPDGSVIEFGEQVPGQLTTGTTTEVQKRTIDLQDQLAQLKSVGKQVAQDHLTYQGRAKGMIGGMLDKAGVSNDLTAFNAERAAALQGVEQFFNEYRRYITGAAAAVAELEGLKKAVISSELGPQEFQARYDALVDKIGEDIQRNLGRVGVQAGPEAQAPPQAAPAAPQGAIERPSWIPDDVEILEVIPDKPQAAPQVPRTMQPKNTGIIDFSQLPP